MQKLHSWADDAVVTTHSYVTQVIEQLIEKKANVNVFDRSGITPLHYAAKHLDFDQVKLLIGKGADPRIVDVYGNSALHYAAMTAMKWKPHTSLQKGKLAKKANLCSTCGYTHLIGKMWRDGKLQSSGIKKNGNFNKNTCELEYRIATIVEFMEFHYTASVAELERKIAEKDAKKEKKEETHANSEDAVVQKDDDLQRRNLLKPAKKREEDLGICRFKNNMNCTAQGTVEAQALEFKKAFKEAEEKATNEEVLCALKAEYKNATRLIEKVSILFKPPKPKK